MSELTITRIFDAPIANVWEAWIEPDRLKKWWGPEGYSAPHIKTDFRVGGTFHFAMQAADGTLIWSTGTYKEIIPLKKIVCTDSFADKHGKVVPSTHYGMHGVPLEMLLTITFEDLKGKTKMTLVHAGLPNEHRAGADIGWNGSLDKLSAVLDGTIDRRLKISRIIQAPRALVWQAFTDPKHLIHWWGPKGFTNTFHRIEVKKGGEWEFIMHGPDGTDYPNYIRFDELKEPELIAYTHGSRKDDPESFTGTTTLEDQGEKTKVTLNLLMPTKEACEAAKKYAIEGGSQTLEKLGRHVEKMPHALFMERTFNAPLEAIWNAWTRKEALESWWGPKGFKMISAAFDLRPGGIFHYRMESPDGMSMWGKLVFQNIDPMKRLSYISAFADERAKKIRHPLAPTWPIETLSIVEFVPDGEKTTLLMESVPVNASPEEMLTFARAKDQVKGGVRGMLDSLETYLKEEP